MSQFLLVNEKYLIWGVAFLSFLVFLFPLLPECITKKVREIYIQRCTHKSISEIENRLGMSAEDIQKTYGNFYLDLKQTFTFNFFILLSTATATRTLTGNSLLVTFTTTSLYICLFNWKIFWDINQKPIAITTIILGIINGIFYILSWFSSITHIWLIPIWLIPMFLAISSITLLGFKSAILKRLQLDKEKSK